MYKTEWLESKGLRKPGQRGRYSKEATEALEQAAIDGITFDDDKEVDYIDSFAHLDILQNHPPPVSIKQRDAQDLWGYTEEGWKVSFDTCGACRKHMIWCSCVGGVAAPFIVSRLEPGQPTRIE